MPSTTTTVSLPYLPHHSIVRLSDGTVGELTWSDGRECRVIHGDRHLGYGPWIMRREQLELANAAEHVGYWTRVERRLATDAAPADVLATVRSLRSAALEEVHS